MLHTFLDISGQYFRQAKTIIDRPSLLRKTIFWKSPYVSENGAHEILAQWQAARIAPDVFRGTRYRFVLTDVELKHDGRIFIPKVYKVRKIGQNIAALLFSEAQRNSATMAYLHDHGVQVPIPIGVLNTYSCGYLTDSVLFQERLPLCCVAYKQFLLGAKQMDDEARLDFYRQVGESLAKVHALGVYTEDTDQNMMVEELGNNRFKFHYFDFDNFYPWRYPTFRRTAHAIRHYADSKHYTCTPDELHAFLDTYVSSRNKRKWLAPLIANIKARRPHIFGIMNKNND
jgi:3-deoxy-D-manno-octulosonic acid kinase